MASKVPSDRPGRPDRPPGPDRPDRPWYQDVVVSTLLRGALRSYGSATRRALGRVGCDDLPRNGAYVVGAIARTGSPLSGIIRELGMSKQAAGQLVDTLVVRGYLLRTPDRDDRRRMTVTLTDRGRLAADAAHGAVEEVDAALTERVGAAQVTATRATLASLVELGGGVGAD
jgi:DNA-binding MarR family transcriptional regulator